MVQVEHADLPEAATLPRRWRDAWTQSGSREFLRTGGEGGSWMTGSELVERTANLAGSLASCGVRAGSRVLWEARATDASICTALGVLRLGAVLVPVSASQTADERRTVAADVEPALIVLSELPDAPSEWPVITPALLAEIPATEVTLDEAAIDELALIIYTSGTTGHPKGVMLTHANLLAQLVSLGRAWRWTNDDRLLTALPLFHVHGLVVSLLVALGVGSSIVVEPRFDATSFVARAQDDAVTMAFCVPTMLHRMASGEVGGSLSALRLVVSGSAPLSTALFAWYRSRGVSILERYGMTETLLTISNPIDGERRAGTVGRALPYVMLDLPADDEDRELLVSGPTVFPGYWMRPAATAEVLRDGWMSTGDIVRIDEAGYVVICGRSKELIITGGFNVYPSEVEDQLLRSPDFLDVAVIGVPSEEWGEEVVACVVVAERHTDLEAVGSLFASSLSSYKRPRRYIAVDAIPRNALGKIQRSLLQP